MRPLATRGAALAILGLALASAAAGRPPDSGLAGRAVAGPTCPVETVPPQPGCAPRPLAVTVRIRRAGSRAPATYVHTGRDGRFRIRLAPATYVVQGLSPSRSGLPRPPAARRVQVSAGHFTYVTIAYDTGIR
jgi:hypothetical protein